MRYLAADSPVEDAMMGSRSNTRFFVSGESIGHKINKWAYSRLKNPSISVTRVNEKIARRDEQTWTHRARCPRLNP
jgi:hypothetical protein